jgi:hypothetical protein
MALFTLRAPGEVRSPQFGSAEGDLDAEMVAIAGSIIRQRTGHFDPSAYPDRSQEALQPLIEAKMKGLTIKPWAVSTPSPVIDLMAALKRSLAKEPPVPERKTAKRKRTKQAPDRRQRALLLPLTRDRKRNQRPSADPASPVVPEVKGKYITWLASRLASIASVGPGNSPNGAASTGPTRQAQRRKPRSANSAKMSWQSASAP